MRHRVLYDFLWANLAFLMHPEMRILNAPEIRILCTFLQTLNTFKTP